MTVISKQVPGRNKREMNKFANDFDGNFAIRTLLSGAIPSNWDDVVLTYTGSNLTGVEYKLDTVTIRTLVLTYTGSQLDRVQVS